MIRKWLFALECECSNVSWERQFPSSYMCVLGTTYREDGDMCEREREREKSHWWNCEFCCVRILKKDKKGWESD